MKELREMSVADLQAKVIECRKALLDLRFQRKAGSSQIKTHRFRQLKRTIARIKTVLIEGEDK
jgi:large subunit ribosomal protein L29